jgi:hypothetical protein
MAFMFNDFGNEYHINDIDGETYDLLYIDSIDENKIKFKENHSLGNSDILVPFIMDGREGYGDGGEGCGDGGEGYGDGGEGYGGRSGGYGGGCNEFTVKNIISPTEIELTTIPTNPIKILIKKKCCHTINFSSLH